MNTVRMFLFTPRIMEMLFPNRWTMHVFYKYDGSTDLDEYLRMFMNQMELYTSSDLVGCKAFSISLKGETLEWFSLLPPNSIDNFTTLVLSLGYSLRPSNRIISSPLLGEFYVGK